MANLDEFVFAELSQKDTDFMDYDITLSGASGAGKTTLAIEMFKGRCCVVDVEKGAKAFDGVYKVTPETWNDLKKIQRQWAKAIKQGHKPPFDVLLFDTQTKLQLMAQEYVLTENDWNDFTQGSDGVNRWNVLKKEYASVMDGFRRMGFKIVRICHGKDRKFKPKNGEEYNQYSSDVGASFDYDVIGSVDFVFYLEKIRVKDGDKTKEIRRLILQNDLNYAVKCRFPELPDEILYEEADKGAKEFFKAWDKAVNGKEDDEDDEPAKEYVKVEEDDEEEVEIPTYDINYYREEASKVRDALMEKMEKPEVIQILKGSLGVANISKCEDVEALKEFIEEYSE